MLGSTDDVRKRKDDDDGANAATKNRDFFPRGGKAHVEKTY
jgi:hypothetical protein